MKIFLSTHKKESNANITSVVISECVCYYIKHQFKSSIYLKKLSVTQFHPYIDSIDQYQSKKGREGFIKDE